MRNKILMTLALLLTAVTGAWAQSSLNVVEFEVPANWANNESPVTAGDLPGFKASTLEEAKKWKGAPAEGYAVLFYAFDGENASYVLFIKGSPMPYPPTPYKKNEVFSNSTSEKFYYTAEPTEWNLTSQDGKTWTLAEMPASNIELQVGYFAESNLFLSKDALADAANIAVKAGDLGVQFGEDGKSVNTVTEGSAMTVTYNGTKKVLGMMVAKKAPKPDLLSGVFSVSSTKKVKFSKGNLSYASSKWSFFDNQYDYYNSYSADAWDHFGWSTSATTYGMNTSTDDNNYSGDFVDWGATMGAGWFTLSKDEWTYLFNTRSASTVGGTENGRYAKAEVNDVMGIILFPDTYTHPDGVTAPTGVNATDNTGWNGNSYTAADWTKMEAAGCVFLPATGGRDGSTMNMTGWYGYYWSATPSGAGYAYYVSLTSSSLQLYSYGRYNGYSVRLVREVTE